MYLICKYWKNNTNSWSIVNVSPTSIVAHSKEINKEQPFFSWKSLWTTKLSSVINIQLRNVYVHVINQDWTFWWILEQN